MTRVIVSGGCGRMGSRIIHLLREDPELELAGVVEVNSHLSVGKTLNEAIGVKGLTVIIESDLKKVIDGGDVVVEFSTPEATISHLEIARAHQKAVVVGTTGLTDSQMELLRVASEDVPILVSPNMSVGVNLLFKLTEEAASALGKGYDVEIIEAHHHFKKDAPSGTAKRLAEIIARAKGADLSKTGVYGRSGLVGPRPEEEIGIHAVRAGDIVGEHTVIFAGTGERIELIHRATSRDTFVSGALKAAKFITGKPAGLYSMQDALQ